MNIYKIWQDKNNDYDTYDSAVVCAINEDRAKQLTIEEFWGGSWTDIENLQIELIGTTITERKEEIIVASYNAG
jgi:hypothetical protein